MRKHLDFSDQCDVMSYDYGQYIGVRISNGAKSPLAGKFIMHIEDAEQLREVLKYLKESGCKIPL